MSTSIPITETQHAEIMKAMNENTLFYKRNPLYSERLFTRVHQLIVFVRIKFPVDLNASKTSAKQL